MAKARASMDYLTRTQSVDAPSVEPRVTISFPAPDRIDLVLRVPVPVQRKGRIKQQIIRQYLEIIASQSDKPSQEPET